MVAIGTSAAYGLSLILLIAALATRTAWGPPVFESFCKSVSPSSCWASGWKRRAKYKNVSAIRRWIGLVSDLALCAKWAWDARVLVRYGAGWRYRCGAGRGGTVPVDGTIIEGSSSLTSPLLTVMSLAGCKKNGSAQVTGGAINCRRHFIGACEKPRRLAQRDHCCSKIIKLVEECAGVKALTSALVGQVERPSSFGCVLLDIRRSRFLHGACSPAIGRQALLQLRLAVQVNSQSCAGLVLRDADVDQVGTGRRGKIRHPDQGPRSAGQEMAHGITAGAFDKDRYTLPEGQNTDTGRHS